MSYIALVNDCGHALVEVESDPKSSAELLVGEESFVPGLYQLTRSGTLDDGRTIYPFYFTKRIRDCAPGEEPLRSIPFNLKGEPAYA